jgi:hypothetical protein
MMASLSGIAPDNATPVSFLGGGLAPLVATALMASSGDNIVTVVGYFVVLSALALVAAWVVKELRGREL